MTKPVTATRRWSSRSSRQKQRWRCPVPPSDQAKSAIKETRCPDRKEQGRTRDVRRRCCHKKPPRKNRWSGPRPTTKFHVEKRKEPCAGLAQAQCLTHESEAPLPKHGPTSGHQGMTMPAIREALAACPQAELNLEFTGSGRR